MNHRQKRLLWESIQILLIILIAVVILAPIVWIILGAFKRTVDIFQLKLFFEPTLENFKTIWGGQFDIKNKLINSTAIAFATVLITIPLATTAAYAFFAVCDARWTPVAGVDFVHTIRSGSGDCVAVFRVLS